LERSQKSDAQQLSNGITELEVNVIVIATHLIKIDTGVRLHEIQFVNRFLNRHFDEAFAEERERILNHCLQKEYDLDVACSQLRVHMPMHTRVQIVRFLFELAASDAAINEREDYFIFRIAGYLNINDVAYQRIKHDIHEADTSPYQTLGVDESATEEEIRQAYRKLVLQYHPDRNKNATEQEIKELSEQFAAIQKAYDDLKRKFST